MARARDRAPSQHAYRGTVGATRTAFIHVTMPVLGAGGQPDTEIVATRVYVSVDVVADPELGQRLLADDPEHALNAIRDGEGRAIALSVPVVYHDPAAEIFALVVGPGDRHRELELRGKLMTELAADPGASVPSYVRDAAVVFGATGLRTHLEQLAERALASQRAADQNRELERERATGERRRTELTGREAELERRASTISDRARELDRRAGELDGREATVAARESEVEGQEADLGRRQHEIEAAHAELARRWQELETVRAEVSLRGAAVDQALEHARTNPIPIIRNVEPAAEAPRRPRTSELHSAMITVPPRRASQPVSIAPAPDATPAPARSARASAEMHAVEVHGEATTIAAPDDESSFEPTPLPQPAPMDVETTNPFATIEPSSIEPLPASADPLTTTTTDLPVDRTSAPPRFRAGDPDARLGVDDGGARLWLRLDQGFAALLADAAANDLDPDAIEDNRAALAQEATALGLTGGGGVVASDGDAFASGMIAPKAARPTLEKAPLAELLAALDDRARRLDAAIELCARRDPAAIRPVMAAVRRMSRAEAVRVLGSMVKFGPAAAPALTAGLASSKAFLRHGCALALALLRSDEGTEAVIDVLLSEPTEIWREIARAVGQVGPQALMPLAARLGRMGDRASASTRERMAWAMAHVAVRGGKAAVETLAGGSSAVAPVARMAMERQVAAAQDDVALREGPARDVTVNRAFSRRFLEAAGRSGEPSAGADASGPMELLDDEDLLIDVDDDLATDQADELDESDLLPG